MPFSTARVDAAVDGAVQAITHVRMHTGAPGGAGTANVAAGVSVETIDFPASAAMSSQDVVTFTVSAAVAALSHTSLWVGDPGAGGVLAGTATVTPAEAFAGAGQLEVTYTATGSTS
jgi:hypothetical protein